jgi:hypothetical protein
MGRAAGVERRVRDDVERRHVIEGERRREDVVLGAPQRVADHRRVEVEELVRVDDALRPAGGARGELDEGDLVPPRQGLRRGLCARADPVLEALDRHAGHM